MNIEIDAENLSPQRAVSSPARCDDAATADGPQTSVVAASSSLERAEAVRKSLVWDLDAARATLECVETRRQELAYDAHANGGDAAKQLGKFNKQRMELLSNIDSLQTALLEAGRRVEDAKRAEESAADAVRAGRALEIAGALMVRAQKIDEALAIVAEESNRFKDDLRELNHRLGCSHPSEFQLQSLGERAVKAGLMFSPFRIEHMAPRERRTFVELMDGWSEQISRWASERLPEREDA